MEKQQFYFGVVEDRVDPLMLGRVKVRVLGIHTEDKNQLPTSDLPWAYKIQPTTSGAISGIGHAPVGVVEGTWVVVQYIDPEQQMPFVVGTIGGIPQKDPVYENNVVTSSDGEVVRDGSGNPVVTEPVPPEPQAPSVKQSDEKNCAAVDVSEMRKQFGPNVDLMVETLCEFGINDQYAVIAILANIAKESRFRPVRENMVYSSVARIRKVFPSKTKGLSDEDINKKYVSNPERLANLVYADRFGNGNEESGDGNKYRGSGFIQLTFRANYRTIGKKIGEDLEGNPTLIEDPKVSAKAAAQYFVDRYKGADKIKFGSLDEALTSITKSVNPGGYQMDIGKVRKYAELCYVIGEPAPTVEQPKQDEPIAPTGGVANGPIFIPSPNNQEGFKDPKGVYPLKDHLEEPDTNRLARGQSIRKTSVVDKEKRVWKGVKKANGLGTWDQSPVPYNAKYPYNNVYQSESGHLLEFDDTPGSERVQIYHKSGTFTEVDHNGTQVNQVVGDGFVIYERNGYVHVSGALHVAVDGAHTLRVQNTLEVEVHGTTTINMHGDANLNVAGDANIISAGDVNVRSAGNTNVDANFINLNSGIATRKTFISEIQGSETDFQPLPVNTRAQDIDFSYEVEDDNPTQVAMYDKVAIENGLATKEELETPPVVEESKPVEPVAEVKDVVCGIAANQKEFTGQEPLSKYFKLADLTSGYSRKLVAQAGRTEAEIFCNLKALATNVLDPIKAKYPGMRVNSAFRRPGDAPGSSTTSQHNLGEAVDISFSDVSTKAQMYERVLEIQKLVPYDQIILEATTSSASGWIHISFKQSGNRGNAFSMFNHRRVSPNMSTIVKLA